LRQRMLDRLVLSDRAVEHDPLLGVGTGLAKRGTAKADCLSAYQHTLRIEAVQNVFEATAFLADSIARPSNRLM